MRTPAGQLSCGTQTGRFWDRWFLPAANDQWAGRQPALGAAAANRGLRVRFSFLARLLVVLLASPLPSAAGDAEHQVPLLGGDDMILVPVQAFHRTLYFIVDTGFTISAIDSEYEADLGPQVDAYTAVSPLGAKSGVPIYVCPAISVAGEPVGLPKIAALDLKMLRLISGRPCDGILGMDWFAKNVVAINFDARTLNVESAPPASVTRTFVPVPLDQSNGFYAMKVVMNGDQTLHLMVDTGDSGSLSLNPAAWRETFSTNQLKTADVTIADAVNNVAQSELGVVGRMAVADLNYTNLHAVLIHHPQHPSRVGLRFFQRHNVTFDLAGGMIYLQPNHDFTTPDTEDMSGLHLLRDGGKTIVYSVSDHSPAAAAGIQARDIIEAVNELPAAALDIQSIRQILRSGDGLPVTLRIRRDAALLDIRVILKQTL